MLMMIAAAALAGGTCDEAGLRAAVARYAGRLAAMDAHGVGQFYLPTGMMGQRGGRVSIGPAGVEKFLLKFKGFHVLSEQMTISGKPSLAQGEWTAAGRYRQKVRFPNGKLVQAGGGFDSRWRCDAVSGWKIRRLETF